MKKWFGFILTVMLMAMTMVSMADSYASAGYRSGDGLGYSQYQKEAVVISKSVTIRSKAAYNGNSLGSASNGDRLTVLDDSNSTWVYVRAAVKNKTIEGWVLRSYIVVQPLRLTLRRSNTPAYCAPDRSSKQVGSLAAYTELDVIGTYESFYIVNLRQASAFVAMDADVWTDTDIRAMFAAAKGTAVTVRKAKTRSGPGTGWPEGKTIPAGEELEISWSQNGWVPALYDDKLYYIEEDDLEVVSSVRSSYYNTGSRGNVSGSAQGGSAGQTITLPRSGGVTLTYWAVAEADSKAQTSGTLSLTQATERAVQELTVKYGLRRRDLMGYEIHYSFRPSAQRAYGKKDPYWSIWFWGGDDEGVLWDVDVNAKTGAILYSSGVDDGNG